MTHLAAVAGVVSISFSAIFMRFASASPATTAFWRAAYALPLLAAAWMVVRRKDDRDRRARLMAFGAGLILALDLVLWQMSIDRIGAGMSVVLANVQVVFVGTLAWLWYRERPTAAAVAAVPVIIAGVAMISGLGGSDAYGSEPVLGVVLGLATAMSYAAFLLLLRHSNRRFRAPAPGPILDATIGTAVGSLAAGLADPGFALSFTWPEHGWFLGLGLLIQGVGWLLITVALHRLAALETSVLLLLQPVLTILWAQLIFDEALSPVQWAGAALVLSGVLVVALRGTVERSNEITPVSAAASPGS